MSAFKNVTVKMPLDFYKELKKAAIDEDMPFSTYLGQKFAEAFDFELEEEEPEGTTAEDPKEDESQEAEEEGEEEEPEPPKRRRRRSRK